MTSDRTSNDRISASLDAACQPNSAAEAEPRQRVSLELALARVVSGHVVPRLAVVTHAKVASVRAQAGRASPVHAPSGQGAAGQSAAGQSAAGQSAAGQSAVSQTAPGQLPAAQAETEAFPVAAVEEFARHLIDAQDQELVELIEALISQGVTASTILLDLFGPAARQLGDWWDEDTITFVDVTVGVGRLQYLVKALPPAPPISHGRNPTILLLPTPGEDHAFGISVLGEILTRAGWSVTTGFQMTTAELRRLLTRQQFDAVGFSLSTAALLDRLIGGIRDVRALLDGAQIPILVGGPVFQGNPALSSRVGADAAPGDARETLAYLARFVSMSTPAEGQPAKNKA